MSSIKDKATITLEKPWLACWAGDSVFGGHQCMSEQLKIKKLHKETMNLNANILHSCQINNYLQRDLAECRKYSIIRVTTFWLQFY